MTARDARMVGTGYLIGCFLATAVCLACGWLDERKRSQ